MRYLYGDLTEARCQEDTLGLLQRFINMAVEVLKLHGEIDTSLLAIQKEKNRLTQTIEDIDGFKGDLQKTINDSFSNRTQDDTVAEMGQAVTATLQQHATEGKARIKTDVERNINGNQAKINQLAGSTFDAMREFFMASGLPISKSSLECNLDGLMYTADSEVADVTGITCKYALDTSRSEFFSGPKRFADLVPGKLEIPIGTKKAWLKKEPVAETIRIDDAILVRVKNSDQSGEYKLSSRAGSGSEGVQVSVDKTPNSRINVFRVDTTGEVQRIPADLFSSQQIEALTAFWTQLFPHVRSLYQYRQNLSAVKIEGKDVINDRLFTAVVGRLASHLAPIIREIDEHSLVKGELSLTIEADEEGKREVFFVRKNKLTKPISALPEMQRRLFAPLGLDVGPTIPGIKEIQTDKTDKITRPKIVPQPIPIGKSEPNTRPESTPQSDILPKAAPTIEVSDEITDVVTGVLVREELELDIINKSDKKKS
ncbi:MAG: hypothetical protein JRJ87_16885 [Deltaproteobacteria bacterium]|nr:hypothetical protein [Deltaproteobacteria bacterium]